MDHRKALRFLAALLFAFAVVAFAASASAQSKDAAAKALQKEAIEKHYLALDFAKSLATLDKAVALCGTDKCSAPVRAAIRRDQGTVHSAAGEKDKAVASFVEAIKIDANVTLDPDLKNADNQAAFDAAKKQAGGKAAPVADTGEQPTGDFTHTPAAEQQIRTPIPIYVEYAGEEPLVKIVARYKGFGMTDWKQIELKKIGEKGWGGLIPCADVQQGVAQYYLQGFNANNDVTATAGDRNRAYKVPVKREKVAEAPHLPNEAPPTQCADTGDCPPNFPGCKKAGATPDGEKTGKDGGEYCEEDSECKSSKCESNKCTEPEKSGKFRRFWVGINATFDYSFAGSSDDVCKLYPTTAQQPGFDAGKVLQPINDKNYYCTDSSGNDYPFRPTAPTQPNADQNQRIVPGTSDKVNGGGVFGNVRILATFDYALNTNILLGLRAGVVLNTYNGQAAKDDGKTFPPLHLEVRGTYLIGHDALLQKFAPYAMVGAGVSTFDVKVSPVSVVEQDPANAQRTAKDVDAWQIAGPGFFTFGGGVRVGFSERAAFMGGLRVNLAFGNSFLPEHRTRGRRQLRLLIWPRRSVSGVTSSTTRSRRAGWRLSISDSSWAPLGSRRSSRSSGCIDSSRESPASAT